MPRPLAAAASTGDRRASSASGAKPAARLPTLGSCRHASAVWDRRFEITTSPNLDGPIDVRALGAAGLRALKLEHRALTKLRLPPGTTAMLPACWRGDRLIAVPGLPAPTVG